MNIAIIGGGSAGLVTAHLLDRAHSVTVFEKDHQIGGLAGFGCDEPGPAQHCGYCGTFVLVNLAA